MIKAGKVLMWIGAIGAVLVIIVGGLVAFFGIRELTQVTNSDRTAFTQTTTVQATKGKKMAIWVQDPDVYDPADCTVTRPDGSELPHSGVTNANVEFDGRKWNTVGYYEPVADEQVTVQCQDSASRLIAPNFSVMAVFATAFGIVGGIVGFGFVFILFALGLILFLVGRSQQNSAQRR